MTAGDWTVLGTDRFRLVHQSRGVSYYQFSKKHGWKMPIWGTLRNLSGSHTPGLLPTKPPKPRKQRLCPHLGQSEHGEATRLAGAALSAMVLSKNNREAARQPAACPEPAEADGARAAASVHLVLCGFLSLRNKMTATGQLQTQTRPLTPWAGAGDWGAWAVSESHRWKCAPADGGGPGPGLLPAGSRAGPRMVG